MSDQEPLEWNPEAIAAVEAWLLRRAEEKEAREASKASHPTAGEPEEPEACEGCGQVHGRLSDEDRAAMRELKTEAVASVHGIIGMAHLILATLLHGNYVGAALSWRRSGLPSLATLDMELGQLAAYHAHVDPKAGDVLDRHDG